MIARPEIQRLARAGGVDERTQERDYVLAWLLAGMATENFGVVFKGGTCLRRCYIPNYRYSEDLDFTLGTGAASVSILDAVATWCRFIGTEAGISADAEADAGIIGKRAWVSFIGPLGSRRVRAIKVDFSNDEVIVDRVVARPLMSEYSDLPDAKYTIPTYSLVEIWAEKARSLMQRSEPRDLYDLHTLASGDDSLAEAAHHVFEAKARAKRLDPADLKLRLPERAGPLKARWESRLRDQAAEVPDFDTVWRAVNRSLRQGGYF